MITIIIDGKEHVFQGDELTSPAHEAIIFLQEQLKKDGEF